MNCKTLWWVVLVGIELASIPFSSADENINGRRGRLSTADYRFAAAVAEAGMMEVRLGELARAQGADIAVRQFGDRMVVDHGIAGNDLIVLAAKKAAILPTQITPEHQRQLDRLRKMSGKDFDQAYARMMVEDHQKDLKEFRKAALTANDPDLKAFAAKLAEVSSAHLDQARQMETKVR